VIHLQFIEVLSERSKTEKTKVWSCNTDKQYDLTVLVPKRF